MRECKKAKETLHVQPSEQADLPGRARNEKKNSPVVTPSLMTNPLKWFTWKVEWELMESNSIYWYKNVLSILNTRQWAFVRLQCPWQVWSNVNSKVLDFRCSFQLNDMINFHINNIESFNYHSFLKYASLCIYQWYCS